MFKHTPLALALLLTLAVVGAACSSSGGSSDNTDPSSTASVSSTTDPLALLTTTSSDTPTTTIPTDPALMALILKTAPSGFGQLPDKLSDSGPTNLAKAMNDEGSTDGGTYLAKSGFVSGYQRVWASSDSIRQNIVFLYRFKTAAGAAQYAANRASELQAYGVLPDAPPVTTFAVTIPGGVGLHSQSATLSFGAVVFSKGLYSVQATSTDGAKVDQTLGVVALAQAQFDRLP